MEDREKNSPQVRSQFAMNNMICQFLILIAYAALIHQDIPIS